MIYGYVYLSRIRTIRRLKHESQRNMQLMWLAGRFSPDFNTNADFRRDNGKPIGNVRSRFVLLCRELKLSTETFVAMGGSRLKAVNTRDQNYTEGTRRKRQLKEGTARFFQALETADRAQPQELQSRTERLLTADQYAAE